MRHGPRVGEVSARGTRFTLTQPIGNRSMPLKTSMSLYCSKGGGVAFAIHYKQLFFACTSAAAPLL